MTGKNSTDSDTPDEAAEDQATTPEQDQIDGSEQDSDAETDGAAPIDMPEDQTPVAASASGLSDPAPAARGPGFLPLFFGGILAGAVGYGAGYLVFSDRPNFELNRMADLTTLLEGQTESLAALEERTGTLEDGLSNLAPPDVDLSGVEGSIADLGTRMDAADATLLSLDARLAEVESRPVLTGEAGTDEAAMAAAMAELRTSLSDQQARNEALAEDIRTLAAEAEARITEAEARAEARVGTASAQAALSELRIALAAGTPFGGALQDVADAEGVEVPDALAAVADTGIPTLEEIQTQFPAAARAALPVALRETAGETAGDRLTAFLRGQVGGRSLEPREGDDPDAVLSRVGAAVEQGDLDATLQELTALPDAALEVMSGWTQLVASRSEALAALDGLAAEIGGN